MGDRVQEEDTLQAMVVRWPYDAALQVDLGDVWLAKKPVDVSTLRNAIQCFDEAALIESGNQEYRDKLINTQTLLHEMIIVNNQGDGHSTRQRRTRSSSPSNYGNVVSPTHTTFQGVNAVISGAWQALRAKSPSLVCKGLA